MKIIVVDDEVLQLETIVEYVSEIYPDAQISSFARVSDVLKNTETDTADVAILDINMPGNINGINLGEMLRQKNRRIKLLYCTGYSHYAMDAFKMHANGYLHKPIQKDALQQELRYVLQMPVWDTEKPYIQTFGNFDVFVGNRPISFQRKKSKEILAYLVDRKGSWVTNQELIVVLWDDTGAGDGSFTRYITILVTLMMHDLEQAGMDYIVERKRGRLRILINEVTCDYYEYLDGSEQAKMSFHGEYMSQYSWGEGTCAAILKNRSP